MKVLILLDLITILENVCAAATKEEHLTSQEPLKRIAEVKSVKDII